MSSNAARSEHREALDGVRLVVVVALAWVGLGWRPGLAVFGGDAAWYLPFFANLLEQGGSFRAQLVVDSQLGGALVGPVAGDFPLTHLSAFLGLSPANGLSLVYVGLQTMLGFLFARAAVDLRLYLTGANESHLHQPTADGALTRVLLGVAFAFAPLVGLRFSAGHHGFLASMALLAAGLSVFCAYLARRPSIFVTLVALLGAWHGASGAGAQLWLYGALFTAPVAVALATRSPDRRAIEAFVVSCGVVVAGAFAASPVLFALLDGAVTGDLPRSAGGQAVDAFATGSAADLVASIFFEPLLSATDVNLSHELLVPFGPWLLVFALFWPRRQPGTRRLLVALAVSTMLALVLALDLEPFATMLTDVVVPLRGFRVPPRALIIIGWLGAVLGLGALALSEPASARERRATAGVGALAIVLMFTHRLVPSPSIGGEAVGWAMEVLLVGTILAARFGRAPKLAALVVLALASVDAFGAHRGPLPASDEDLTRLAHLGRAARDQFDEGARGDALVRVEPAFMHPRLGPNAITAMGLSSLDGYWNPTRRFLSLFLPLHGRAYDPTVGLVDPHADRAAFAPLAALYDICCFFSISASPSGEPTPLVERVFPVAGPAWFVGAVEDASDPHDIARALLAAPDPVELVRSKALVDRSDHATSGVPSRLARDACRGARVTGVRRDVDVGSRLVVDVDVSDECTLVVSRNWFAAEEVHAVTAAGRVAVPSFPAWGALLGVAVPAGTQSIEVGPREVPRWRQWLQWGAVLLAVACLAYAWRSLHRVPATT